jgi:flagellar secretion chaperone FliS
MAVAAPYRQGRDYMRSKVETASKTQLVMMLYDGAIRFLTIGREKMLAGDIEAQNSYICKAQRILGELISTLDHQAGGEIADNLNRLYIYMLQRLVEANVNDQPEAVEEAIELLRELRAGWEQVDAQTAGAN